MNAVDPRAQVRAMQLELRDGYTEADADAWLAHVAADTAKQGRSVNWAIRDPEGKLIGGIGFTGLQVAAAYRAELGYWLAKPFWGRGLMTEAAGAVCAFAFAELAVERITAQVLHCNAGSSRVLEKSGFELEGRLRQHVRKDGKSVDVPLYGRLAD